MSSEGSFLRRSFRKSKKRKDTKVDKDSHRQSTTNFALALGEVEHLPSENRRLRQELEYERTKNRRQSNDFRFPSRNNLVSTGQQTDDLDVVYRRTEIHELEKENKELKRKIQELEERTEQNNVLKNLQARIESLQQQLASTREGKEDIVLTELKKIQKHNAHIQKKMQEMVSNTPSSDTDKCMQNWAANKDSDKEIYQANLEEVKNLIVRYSEDACQRVDAVEEALASEMKATSLLQIECTEASQSPEVQKMASDVKAFACMLQSKMVTMDKVKHFSRELGVDPEVVEGLSSKDSVSPRDVFWSALCLWYRNSKDKDCLGHLHRTSSQAGIRDNGVMPETDRQTLEKCHTYLVKNLHPIVTLHYLRNKGHLDASDVYYVTSECARPERCARLLALLPLFGEHAFDTLCEALNQSVQRHLVETLKEHIDTGYGEEDTERTIRKHAVSETSPNDPGLQRGRVDSIYHTDYMYINVKILSTLLAKCSNIEAMMMDRSSTLTTDSNYFSLSRSEREKTL